MSEARNNAELMSINGVLRAERSVTQASTRHPTDRRNALTVEDDSNTHAYVTTPPRSRFKSALTRFFSFQHVRN